MCLMLPRHLMQQLLCGLFLA